ncbi:MAG: hypothetical protein HXY25_04345, partial [Alphaproteobacteria bacterium]|nr:hypothetical protein [Alphaproteobacteria bacterium]
AEIARLEDTATRFGMAARAVLEDGSARAVVFRPDRVAQDTQILARADAERDEARSLARLAVRRLEARSAWLRRVAADRVVADESLRADLLAGAGRLDAHAASIGGLLAASELRG